MDTHKLANTTGKKLEIKSPLTVYSLYTFFCRETVSNVESEGDTNFQKSTGALISDKDRELETLRNEVLTLSLQYLGHSTFVLCNAKYVRYLSVSIGRSRCCEEKTPWPRPCSRPWKR